MKKRLKEIEEEAGALREMQAKVEKEMGAVQGSLSFCISIMNVRQTTMFGSFYLYVYHIILS